jgi:hypothetical protein
VLPRTLTRGRDQSNLQATAGSELFRGRMPTTSRIDTSLTSPAGRLERLGEVECSLTTCDQLGKKGEILARLRHGNGTAAFNDMRRPAQL